MLYKQAKKVTWMPDIRLSVIFMKNANVETMLNVYSKFNPSIYALTCMIVQLLISSFAGNLPAITKTPYAFKRISRIRAMRTATNGVLAVSALEKNANKMLSGVNHNFINERLSLAKPRSFVT